MILLTGATGFVIANLARHLSAKEHEVLAADLNSPDAPLREFVSEGAVTFRQVDVTDRDAVRDLLLAHSPAVLSHRLPPARLLRRIPRWFVGTRPTDVEYNSYLNDSPSYRPRPEG
jgi:saccharopine dehydrogenase-like NADP-dependent oxidoreductase